jgi:hypothetical protein
VEAAVILEKAMIQAGKAYLIKVPTGVEAKRKTRGQGLK